MKVELYSKNENLNRTILSIQKYFKVLYDLDYSIEEVTDAFNRLTTKYQNLLLKPNKNENDKAMLRFPYSALKNNLMKKEKRETKIKENEEVQKIEIKEVEEVQKTEVDCKKALDFIDTVDMNDEDKIIIIFKYDDGNIKPNDDLANAFSLKTTDVDEIVSRFWSIVNDMTKKNKPKTLEIEQK